MKIMELKIKTDNTTNLHVGILNHSFVEYTFVKLM